jgi:protein-S-isoprenylcysteine O-methyltransferase Ste14
MNKSLSERGAGPIGLGISILVWALCITLQRSLPLPQIQLSAGWRWSLTLLFLADGLGTLVWSGRTLGRSRRSNEIARTGPYALVRHPIYGAFLWSGTATVAFAFQSWLVLLAVVPLHLIWARLVQPEEEDLCHQFGSEYAHYAEFTGQFFPSIASLKKITEEPRDLDG